MRKSKRSSGSALQETRGDRIIHVVAAALLGLIILCLFYPMWAVVVASFSNPTELYQKSFLILPTEWTLESYRMVFRDKDFLMGLRNSVLYTVTGTALNVVMNICGAYPLSKRRLKGRSVLMFLFTFTMFFSGGMVPTYLLISRLHLLDTIWAILLPSAVGMYNTLSCVPIFRPPFRRNWRTRQRWTAAPISVFYFPWCCPCPSRSSWSSHCITG